MDHRRCGRLWAVSLLVASCAAGLAGAADAGPWVTDYPSAVRQAREQAKLLFVLDVSDDFLAGQSPEGQAEPPQAKLYRALAMSDPRVAKLLAERYVCTVRAVGQASAIQMLPAKDERLPTKVSRKSVSEDLPPASSGDFALAYVCLPSGHVLHFVPGFVSAEQLLEELQWADAINRDRLRAPPTEKRWFIRQRHLAAAHPVYLKAFRDNYTTRWLEGFQAPKLQSDHDLREAARVACRIRQRDLVERLKANWAAESHKKLIAALAAHGGLEPGLAHLVLAEFPLPLLEDVQCPLYQAASLQRYWQVPPGRESLRTWWEMTATIGGGRLLVVADDPYLTAQVVPREELDWSLVAGAMGPDLKQFAVREVTLDELALLVHDADLEPIQFRPSDGPPRYLIHDTRGFRLAELSARDGTTKRLAQVLHALVNSGDLAAATGAERGDDDED